MRTLFVFLTLVSLTAFGATDCPDTIQYYGGGYLKRGDTFYYPNAAFLLRGNDTLYYPAGSFLKRGDYIYYPSGSYVVRGENLYYPNGAYLKRGDNYYYSNGAYLKRDTDFYYANGQIARRDGVLYRPDGTVTPFPSVTLGQPIANIGFVQAKVEKDKEKLDVDFRNFFLIAGTVRIDGFWNGTAFARFELIVNTGVPGEDVLVRLENDKVTCQLAGGK